jgi:type III polyketide synthase
MSVDEISTIFMKNSVELAVSAARAANADAGISIDDITHVVSTTCTNSSNLGFEALVARDLGLQPMVEKVLLHGVGCAGGLAGLWLASTLCEAAVARGRPVNVLVVSCEVTSTLGRYYLDCLDTKQEFPMGLAIYGDAAGALVVSPETRRAYGQAESGIFEVVSSTNMVFPGTEGQLIFSVGPHGSFVQCFEFDYC